MEKMRQTLLNTEQRQTLEADRADLVRAVHRGEYEAGAEDQIRAIDAMLKGEQAPTPTAVIPGTWEEDKEQGVK